MRLPNSYGSIVKLSGKRRRPYAVRITTGWTDEGRQIQKYLSYHAKRSDAMAALAEYNKNPYEFSHSLILRKIRLHKRFCNLYVTCNVYHTVSFYPISTVM